jgi:hypothetical protein
MTQPTDGSGDSSSELHFQKLDVYQGLIEFLALAHRVRERLPSGTRTCPINFDALPVGSAEHR